MPILVKGEFECDFLITRKSPTLFIWVSELMEDEVRILRKSKELNFPKQFFWEEKGSDSIIKVVSIIPHNYNDVFGYL